MVSVILLGLLLILEKGPKRIKSIFSENRLRIPENYALSRKLILKGFSI